MKFKNKILLASASLLVLSGAAASTGVFAWYTANRAAEVKVTTMTATSTEGALAITDGDGDEHGVEIMAKNSNAGTNAPDLTINPKTNAYLVDVTGNGDGTFNKPFYVKKSKEFNVTDMVGHWGDELAYQANYSENAYYYYSFDLKFSISGGDGSYGLLLSRSCKLTDTNATTTVADTVRLSANAGDRKVYANINGTDTGYYTYSDPAWTEVTSIEGGTATQGVLTSGYFGKNADGSPLDEGSTPKDSSTFNTTDNNYLGSIPANKELTVTFYVWVEGHASENTDAKKDLAAAGNSSATFDLSLKFYTIKAEAKA
jgi:hypothetical protein